MPAIFLDSNISGFLSPAAFMHSFAFGQAGVPSCGQCNYGAVLSNPDFHAKVAFIRFLGGQEVASRKTNP